MQIEDQRGKSQGLYVSKALPASKKLQSKEFAYEIEGRGIF